MNTLKTRLLGPNGQPISSSDFQNKKANPPVLGTSFGRWAGDDVRYMTLPGGAVVQFDLSKLEVADFRAMRDHYQVNASLAALSFMMHQSDFHVECEDKTIAEYCDAEMHENWTVLNRSMSQAHWAGYSPSVIEWENDYLSRKTVIKKVKDLIPEECSVHWRDEEGWAPPGHIPPKFKIFDGINQLGMGWPVPVENSFWYPVLMQNGDYYGTKLLRPAFQSWFFSILLHLFSNRYFERFGEPVPIGRAPFDDNIDLPDSADSIPGNTWMLGVLQALRSRSAVVLPNASTEDRNGKINYDYTIEYLESQMRGADFERYMTRLDEEISLGLFTPLLLMRTADVGSYNLGQGHMQLWLWMLNALNGDRKFYLDNYVLSPMVDYNFSPNAPRAKIIFRKLGNIDADTVKQLLLALINKDKAQPDIQELGEIAGMTLKQIRTTQQTPSAAGEQSPTPNPAPTGKFDPEVEMLVNEVNSRVRGQVESAWREGRFANGLKINIGYKRKCERTLSSLGFADSMKRTNRMYGKLDHWLADTVTLGDKEFSGPDSFMALFNKVLEYELKEAVNGASK